MTTRFYRAWPEQAAEIRERLAQPVTIDGKRYVCSRDAATLAGVSMSHLRHTSQAHPGDGPHTTSQGWIFVRRPRGKDDKRAPLYWLEDSLR